ncbi:hypothetical protein CANTEDRAFT_117566 [Yamadazyma tenuis ATCC 10573]|uniref:SAGA-associated factor 11 n=2 Tax=Candida tenuis TaxID=2315449 RepID=G3AWJ5_CANTC|nr:uncharacterized protein CANTEDRAFT_117566 [Yamadazyma tenuis ATCC 10573]EGV66554.1 hypothetical protein CANTEDRAFT_117566 [Yamadazyma tenuis ATCC 10573]
MMFNLIKHETLDKLALYKAKTASVDSEGSRIEVLIKEHNVNLDIFNQDKVKLKTADTNKYFTCENCGRSISGGRFAQHINKCLERKRR